MGDCHTNIRTRSVFIHVNVMFPRAGWFNFTLLIQRRKAGISVIFEDMVIWKVSFRTKKLSFELQSDLCVQLLKCPFECKVEHCEILKVITGHTQLFARSMTCHSPALSKAWHIPSYYLQRYSGLPPCQSGNDDGQYKRELIVIKIT